jgi:hypothetical protein
MVDEMAAEVAILEELWAGKQGVGFQLEEMAPTSRLVCLTLEQEIPWTISMAEGVHPHAQVHAAKRVADPFMGDNSAKINSMGHQQVIALPQASIKRSKHLRLVAPSPWASK